MVTANAVTFVKISTEYIIHWQLVSFLPFKLIIIN